MSETVFHPQIWRSVAQETTRFWIRRHNRLVLGVGIAALAAALFAVTGHTDQAGTVLAGIIFYAPFIAGLVVMSGIVSDERESGLIELWLQKPGTLARAYVMRYTIYQVLLAACAAGIGLIVGAIAVSGGVFTIMKAVRIVPVMASVALISAAIVFAFSAWGVRRDSTVAFFAIVVGVSLAGVTAFSQTTLSQLLRVVAFPVDSFLALAGGSAYSPNLTRPITIIVAQLAIWTLFGLIGLRLTERRHRNG